MGKSEVVSEQKAKILADQDLALQVGLEATYDAGVSEGVASVPTEGGGPSEEEIQARIDAAVSQALASDEVSDQAHLDELGAMITGLQEQISTLQSEHDALVLKEGAEAQALEQLKASKAQLQAVVEFLSSLMTQPEPQPEV
jgi:vacuolar-type H+-ATPase subunit I/STV1